MSKCTPITAKAKNSPFKANQSLIDGAAYAYGSVKGKDREETTTKTTRKKKAYVGAENDACSAVYIAKHGDAACKRYKALSQEKKDAANYDTVEEKETKIVPGEDVDYRVELKKAKKSDVLQPWEVRQQSRAIKKQARDTYSSKRKSAKYQRKLDKLKERGKSDSARADRLRLKKERADYKVKEFEAAAERGKITRSSGKKGGSSDVYGGDMTKTTGMLKPDEQRLQAAKEALRNQKNKANSFKNFIGKTGDTNTASVDTFLGRDYKSRVGAGTPAFKKRSSFKMKGYGKR